MFWDNKTTINLLATIQNRGRTQSLKYSNIRSLFITYTNDDSNNNNNNKRITNYFLL